MKKILIVPVILMILSGSIYSQQIRDFMHLTEESVVFNKSVVDMPGYTGSPYLNKQFSEGKILSAEGIQYEKVPLRYNIYNEIFEFEKDGSPYNIDPLKFGLNVFIGDQAFIYTNLNYNKSSRKGYLELIESGNFRLYKRYMVRYDRPEGAGAYSDPKPGNFVRLGSEYFLQSGEAGEINFITKESGFLKACGTHENRVKVYMKDNRLKIKKEKDLIEIIKYLNSL